MLQLNGMSRDESIALVPYTVEEMIALDHVAMLNENIDIDGTETVDGREIQLTSIQSIDEDHMSFIYFYKRAIDTPAKYKAIKLRKRAMRRKQLMGI